MTDKYVSPSDFANAVNGMTFIIAELHGRAPRTSATIAPASTLAQCIVGAGGRISSFRMKALDTGTTSSATFNTASISRIPAGSITATVLATIRTNRGANGASSVATPSGATALVNPGDMLVIRRLTKLNTASQLFVSAEVTREVRP